MSQRPRRFAAAAIDSAVPVKLLGAGSLSEVLLVEIDGNPYALKRALPHHRHDPRVTRLLREEAAVCDAFSSPHTPHFFGSAETRDGPALVFERLQGLPLIEAMSDVAGARVRFSVPEVKCLISDVLLALNDAHRARVVHRDVGPHNVMLTPSGHAALFDFGIALADARERFTRTGALRGALLSLSPEAVRGETITAAADLFAVGVLGFELLTGTTPFVGKTRRALLSAVAAGDAQSCGDPALDAFFVRALNAKPEQRFSSSTAMLAAVSAWPSAGLDVGRQHLCARQLALCEPLNDAALGTRTSTRT